MSEQEKEINILTALCAERLKLIQGRDQRIASLEGKLARCNENYEHAVVEGLKDREALQSQLSAAQEALKEAIDETEDRMRSHGVSVATIDITLGPFRAIAAAQSGGEK